MGGWPAVTTEQRLAEIARALQEEAGIDALVMGGHAVRHYGVERNTIDFDFCTGAASTDEVRSKLALSHSLGELPEGPSWRPHDFARFELGKLADGREEWLEFWVRNHLLADFNQLHARAERGTYGGRELAFLSLTDLLRSKETERESDWQDIALLEEIRDLRHLASAKTDARLVEFLSSIRSRRGFERAMMAGAFDANQIVRNAIHACVHPISYAFLVPRVKDAIPVALSAQLEPAYLDRLRQVEFGAPKHLVLVEVVRRAYKRHAMELDRQDKQRHLNQG